MTIDELQVETLRLIRKVRRHLTEPAWKGGPTDAEFDEEVLEKLQTQIEQDREVMRMAADKGHIDAGLPKEFGVKLIGERVSELRFQNADDAKEFARLAMQEDEQNKIEPTRFELFEEVCV